LTLSILFLFLFGLGSFCLAFLHLLLGLGIGACGWGLEDGEKGISRGEELIMLDLFLFLVWFPGRFSFALGLHRRKGMEGATSGNYCPFISF